MLRLTKGWSQEALAAASGLDRSYVSAIERAQRNVSLDNVEKLADAFGLTLNALLNPPDATRLGEQVLKTLTPTTKRKES